MRYFLGCFEEVFAGMFFLNRFKQKVHHKCPKHDGVGGGEGVKVTFGKYPKVSSFVFRVASLIN